MKKIIVSAILLVALLVCKTGCSTSGGAQPPSGGGNPPADQTVYEKLSELAAEEYKKVNLSIVTVTNGIELSAEYIMSGNIVLYSIEQLNLFSPDGDISELSPEYKARLVGSAVVSNGEIKMLDGENVTLPSYDELKGSFNFVESNFKNADVKENSLCAEIVSPSDFYGASVNVQNMTIDVEYSDLALVKMVITYQMDSSTVTTTYEFEN